jgi:FdhD protein
VSRRRTELESDAVREVDVLHVAGAETRSARDRVAHEEPLEIQLGGAPLAVVMRTPGDDLELVTGFLVTERVLDSLADLEAVRHCTAATAREAEDNVVQVTLRAGVRPDLERLRRNLFASSSCGVCGKATLENALATAPPLEDVSRLRAGVLTELPARLRAAQRAFDETGGLHAAGLFDREGRLLVAREDVGRHNAVDKVVGWAARTGRLPPRRFGARGVGPRFLRDRAEGTRGADSDRRGGLGAIFPGRVARRQSGHRAGGLPARARLQRLRRAREDRPRAVTGRQRVRRYTGQTLEYAGPAAPARLRGVAPSRASWLPPIRPAIPPPRRPPAADGPAP